MTLSGSVSTNAHDGRYMKVSWSGVQDVAANKTTVSWTINAIGGSDSWCTTGPVKLKINGSWVYWNDERIDMRTSWSASGATDIPHNEDGTKSFGIRLEAAVELYAINCTGEGSFTLDPIARNPDAPTAFTASAGHGSMVGVGQSVLVGAFLVGQSVFVGILFVGGNVLADAFFVGQGILVGALFAGGDFAFGSGGAVDEFLVGGGFAFGIFGVVCRLLDDKNRIGFVVGVVSARGDANGAKGRKNG